MTPWQALETGDCIVPDWPAPANVNALITTRAGGVSVGSLQSLNLGRSVGDDPEAVEINRHRVAQLVGATPRWMSQVHGIDVAALDDIRADVPITADAAVSRCRRTVCTAMMADCLTVLFTDRGGSVVAAAHAGWRGLAAGVLEATVAGMHAPPETIIAYMGPAIGPAAFEVGEDVLQSFVTSASPDEVDAVRGAFCSTTRAVANAAPGKWRADLYRLARIRIERAGVLPDAIFGGGLCTYTDSERFFSHRRGTHEGMPSGRMAAMIWLS